MHTYNTSLGKNESYEITYVGYIDGYEMFYLNDSPNIQLMFGYQSSAAFEDGGYIYFVLSVNGEQTESFIQTEE